MADAAHLRQRAREQHAELRALLTEADHPLIPAEALLRAAQSCTGIAIQQLPPDDPLLSGAQALLDRESEMIWLATGGGYTPERQRFAQAHEFAHYWLHPELERDPVLPDDSTQTFMAELDSGSSQVEEGYSPHERREREANLFAAELLLPSPQLKSAFLELGMCAADIAAHCGLSETCVLTQLSQAVLAHNSDEPRTPASGARDLQDAGPAPAPPLDPSQRAAAETQNGPTLVDAGPGTGKTRTLTARILYLIEECGVQPENIAALTFSHRAAQEMIDRLRAAVGATADRVWIGTFHAFGLEMLRKEGHQVGLPARPAVIDVADAIDLLERHLDELDLQEFEFLHNPIFPFPDILDCISRAKDELKSPEEFAKTARELGTRAETEADHQAAMRAAEIARVYAVYSRLLRQTGSIDYGDMIARAVELLESCPDVRDRWRRQYPHILADEYQDVNRATAQMLKLLAGDSRGFWAVGDLRQAIYRFRGASPANIRQFDADFPGGQRLALSVNYRSRPGIVETFSAMCTRWPELSAGSAWTPIRDGAPSPAVRLLSVPDETVQADYLAEAILSAEQAGVPLREQAILVATNRQSEDLARALLERGVPVEHVGPLFERAEVKDMMALLSLATEPEGVGLLRVARFPEYSIPAADVRLILSEAARAGWRFPMALSRAAELPLSAAGAAGIRRLSESLTALLYRGDAWSLLTRYLFETSRYLQTTCAGSTLPDQQKRRAILQLLLTLQHLTQRLPESQRAEPRTALLNRLRRLLQIRQARSARLPGSRGAGVQIMTVHQAKGLEFPLVYLPNLIRGQFPPRGRPRMANLPPELGGAEGAADQSARELFFVALSRARDELVMLRPEIWRGRSAEPSPLLESLSGLRPIKIGPLPAQRRVAPLQPAAQSPGVSSSAGSEPPAAEGGARPGTSPLPQLAVNGAGLTSGRRPDLTLSAVRQYLTCPRQFYYQRVVEIPERGEDPTYAKFHSALQESIAWLQRERGAGRTPSATETSAIFGTSWPVKSGGQESAHERLLRKRAIELLGRIREQISEGGGISEQTELRAQLTAGAIRLRADQWEAGAEGRVRVTRHLHRRPKRDDHTDPPLSLLRLAARQRAPERNVEIALFSTATGETREVAEDRRWEPKRIERYEIALRGITEGQYPAEPSDDACSSCPFFFVCPAG